MAIRKVVKYGDEILRIKSKEVHKVSKKVQLLVDDLIDTLYAINAVGLAAPQIGEHSRVFVVDVSPENQPANPIVFINPKIIKKSGAMNSLEGCMSFPEVYVNVRRYENVTVKALDINGRPFILEGKNGELLAKAIQHEFDHLEGILFIDHCRNRFEADSALQEKGFIPVQVEKLLDESDLEEEIQKKPPQEIQE